jgi:hypothetical protein
MGRFSTAEQVLAHLRGGGDDGPQKGRYPDYEIAASDPDLILCPDGNLIITHTARRCGTPGYLVRHAGTGQDVTAWQPFLTLGAAQCYAAGVAALGDIDWNAVPIGEQLAAVDSGFWAAMCEIRVAIGWQS